MDSSSRCNRNAPPTCSHHHHHHHHYHRRPLDVSPNCPFPGFLLQPNGQNHHHHLELSPHCPLHSSLLQTNGHHNHHLLPHCPHHSSPFHQINQSNHFPLFPNFASPAPYPPNPELTVSVPSLNNINSQVLEPQEIYNLDSLNEELEPENEEEFEFVLTDEWKEFFAKSEAKRRLAKKHGKRKGKD